MSTIELNELHRTVPVVDVAWPHLVPPPGTIGGESFLRATAAVGPAVPARAVAALHELTTSRHGVGALVVRGVDVGTLDATPSHPTAVTDKDHTSELSLLTVARLLGEPVGYLPEHGGDIVQNIIPTAAEAAKQTSTSSRVELAFHTETAFHPHRPRFLLLLCLRGDESAATTLCCIDDILPALSDAHRRLLHERRFHTRADESFGGGADAEFGPPMAVLTGSDAHPTLVYDAQLTRGIDAEAQAALDELGRAIEQHHTSIVLSAGDLLVIDNDRCVHGRSPFRARFDGTDRWLQRTFVVDDLAASAHERRGRIITTTF